MAAGAFRFHLQDSLAGTRTAFCSRSRATAWQPRPCNGHLIRRVVGRPGAVGKGDLAVSTSDVQVGGIGGGGGLDNGSGGGGSGKGDDGAGSEGVPGGLEALLLAAGRSIESLPGGFAAAVRDGKASKEALELYLKLERNPLMRPFLGIAGFRERLLADPGFFVKLSIELGIGLVCKITAEAQKRGESFKNELDFVFANVVMALIADFMLVWLPAPTLSFSAQKVAKQGKLQSFLRSCPDNAFQVVPPGREPWSLVQRSAAVGRNGAKLLGVGFGASMFGVTITNVLLEIRKRLDPDFKAQNPPQNVLAMSAAYASYMASSSNIRYQIMAGVLEERGVERLLHGNALACGAASFVIRTANTFLGSLLWVDYLRLIGLQKKAETAKK